MKRFLTVDFLLENSFSAKLYHDYAAKMPIIDYHNHLSPQQIAENRQFKTITEAWLEGDHYKWRAMRTFGIDEKYITGNASDSQKFSEWAKVVPYTVRNPLYHWTHLELQRYFEIENLLSPETSDSIYSQCNEVLTKDSHRCQGLLTQFNVETLCTTDDPVDDLSYHKKIRESNFKTKVLPTFRPDKMYAIDKEEYRSYISTLREVVGFPVKTFEQLMEAMQNRIDFFDSNGCRLSDHGLEVLYDVEYSVDKARKIFAKKIADRGVSQQEVQIFKMTMLIELSKMYHAKGWTQQFHLGAIRNNNTRMMKRLGPDTGFDSIGDYRHINGLQKFLDTLDLGDQLTKTILYNLNPADNEAFATMTGNFMDGRIPGKVQYGSGWWFLDQKDGMTRQLDTLSNMGLLSQFIGMLTDSRSFLSFPRHEYFRRILCNLIGKDVENGELPSDEKLLGKIVQDICYFNAKKYLKFDK